MTISRELCQDVPPAKRRAEEQRVLDQPTPHRLGGQIAGSVGRQVDRRAAPVVARDARGTLHVELQLPA